mmetsp:Transcript_93786/g.268450  ORF Transcript_93786/g.268450 Transcript_93786/m.268450 type:complete len:207 (+) Transcript_93786:1977-2597(+)
MLKPKRCMTVVSVWLSYTNTVNESSFDARRCVCSRSKNKLVCMHFVSSACRSMSEVLLWGRYASEVSGVALCSTSSGLILFVIIWFVFGAGRSGGKMFDTFSTYSRLSSPRCTCTSIPIGSVALRSPSSSSGRFSAAAVARSSAPRSCGSRCAHGCKFMIWPTASSWLRASGIFSTILRPPSVRPKTKVRSPSTGGMHVTYTRKPM